MATASNRRASGRDAMERLHPSQVIALAVGLAYTAVGIVGFAITGFDEFFGRNTGETLLGFELNPAHNVVHLVIGLAGLAMWRRLDYARAYGWALFVGYGAAFVYGLFAVEEQDINILSLNGADNGLHLASAAVGLAAALWPVRSEARSARGRTSTA
jgi:hypothetical protein